VAACFQDNLLLFKSLSLRLQCKFLLICVTNILKHLVSTVKQDLGIPCSLCFPVTPQTTSPSPFKLMDSKQGQADAANGYVRLLRRFSSAQAVAWFFVQWKKDIFEEFQPLCSGVPPIELR